MSLPEIQPVGDAAFMVDVGDQIDPAVNRHVRMLAAYTASNLAMHPRVDVTAAYAAFMVSFDPSLVAAEVVMVAIREAIARAGIDDSSYPVAYRRFTVSVAYGGAYGPDLEDVAAYHDISVGDVIARHSGRDYPIYCLGFSPGFPFLGNLDPSLNTPRLETPRPRVPAGAVGIGGSQTGIYPTVTPGGWRLIGRTPVTLFDVGQIPPVPYEPGDVIRFESISHEEYARVCSQKLMPVGVAMDT